MSNAEKTKKRTEILHKIRNIKRVIPETYLFENMYKREVLLDEYVQTKMSLWKNNYDWKPIRNAFINFHVEINFIYSPQFDNNIHTDPRLLELTGDDVPSVKHPNSYYVSIKASSSIVPFPKKFEVKENCPEELTSRDPFGHVDENECTDSVMSCKKPLKLHECLNGLIISPKNTSMKNSAFMRYEETKNKLLKSENSDYNQVDGFTALFPLMTNEDFPIIFLYFINNVMRTYKVMEPLSSLLPIKTGTYEEIFRHLFLYIKSANLFDNDNSTLIICDDSLQNITKQKYVEVKHLGELVNKFLAPSDPYIKQYIIKNPLKNLENGCCHPTPVKFEVCDSIYATIKSNDQENIYYNVINKLPELFIFEHCDLPQIDLILSKLSDDARKRLIDANELKTMINNKIKTIDSLRRKHDALEFLSKLPERLQKYSNLYHDKKVYRYEALNEQQLGLKFTLLKDALGKFFEDSK